MRDRILEYYKKFGKKHYTRPIRKDLELVAWLHDQTSQDGALTLPEQIACVIHNQSAICEVSNNKRKFIDFEAGFGFCGKATKCECARKQVSGKVSQSKLKYSTEQKQEIQKKRERTNLQKYGVINQGQRSEVKNKQKAFYQNPNNLKDLHTRIQSTIKSRYKTIDDFYQSRNQKSIETNIKKYGVENPMQHFDINQKASLTRRTNYNPSLVWSKNYDILVEKMKSQHGIIILTPKSEYTGLRLRPIMNFQCANCNNEWQQRFDHANFPRCKLCHPSDIRYKSHEEIEILDFIKGLGFKVESGNRSLIYPYEVDIVIPEKKIAIEYCGLYWHSENSSGKGFGYHKKKFDLLKDKGYQLLTIFSDEWLDKKEIIKSMVCNKLGVVKYNRIFSRKTDLILPSRLEVENFLEEYHILGSYKKQNIAIGLSHNGEMVACGVFVKLKDHEYELVRFATSNTVIGGASKILKNFCKMYSVRSVVSFSDNRFSVGNLYQTLGFEMDGIVPPMQYYVYKYSKRYHKMKFEKAKLVKMGYDASLSEWEILQSLGYDRIWDCGKIRWKYEYKH